MTTLQDGPLLSILIPTFNRGPELERCIEGWIKCIEATNLNADFEIVISDNASEDNTFEICRSLIQNFDRHIRIRYHRNSDNLGCDGNYHSGINLCKGQYVWLFSDDDQIREEALKRLTPILKTQDYDYIFVNYEMLVAGMPVSSDLSLKQSKSTQLRDIFWETNFALSFVASNIFRKSKIDLDKTRKYIGYNWMHIYFLLSISPAAIGYILASPLVVMNCKPLKESRAEKNISETNAKCEFYMQAHLSWLSFCLDLSKFGYVSGESATAMAHLRSQTARQVLYLKHAGPPQTSEQRRYIFSELRKHFTGNKLFLSVVMLILWSPNFLVSPAYTCMSYLYKMVKSKASLSGAN